MSMIVKQPWWILLVASAVACSSSGGNTGIDESPMSTAGTGTGPATSGRAATPSTAKGGSGGKAAGGTTGGSAVVPRAGRSAPLQPTAAGTGGTTAMMMGDEDAGVGPGANMATAGTSGSLSAGTGGSPAAAGTGGSSSGPSAGSGGSTATAATFTEVYAVLSSSCAGTTCHVNAVFPADMLSMPDQATAYMNLVNVASTACAGEKRVVPGDTDKSELLHTLTHTQAGNCFRTPRMPEGKPQLSDSDIALVSSWIKAGAKNN